MKLIPFYDCVLGAHVQRVVALESVLEARLREARDRRVRVVHAHEDAWRLELVGFHLDGGLRRVLWL